MTDTPGSTATAAPEVPRDDLSAVIKAYDVRGVVGEQIDASLVRELGAALARLLRAESAETGVVVVGHDMRPSSPELADAFAEGVAAHGLDVVNIGLASTDMLYFASGALDLPGAMFTASHNPAKYNGIKLCRAGAAPIGADTGLATIREAVEQGVPAPAAGTGRAPSRSATCSPTTPPTCAAWSTCRPAGRCGSSSTPATGWPATRCPRCSPGCRWTSCRSTSSWTAPSPTTRRTRWTRRTWSTCRRPSSPRVPTSGWPSTATPTAASSSTSAASR